MNILRAGRRKIIPLSLIIFSAGITTTDAHMFSGQSAVFSGLAQPFIHMIGLIFLLSCGLFNGVVSRKYACSERLLLGFFFGAVLFGAFIPWAGIEERGLSMIMMGAALLMAGLIAADCPFPPGVTKVVNVLGGLLTALYFLQESGLPWIAGALFDAAFFVGIFCLMVGLAYGVKRSPPAVFIAVRVAGSWLFAMSMMILAAFFAHPLIISF